MAAKWQQWMPFHIDRFRGSPDVQAMHPAARCGFLYLLAAAWQTEDCSISSDPLDLATASGLSDELWALYGPRIVRKFEMVDGRLANRVLLDEWRIAKSVYDKRKSGAERTNESRSPNAERTQSERSADTVTGTVTVHKQSTEQETLAVTADAVPAGDASLTIPVNDGSEFPISEAKVSELALIVSPMGEICVAVRLPLADGSEFALTEEQCARWQPGYPGVDVGLEMHRARNWLEAHPRQRKTRLGVLGFCVSWLGRAQNSARPNGGNNGTGRSIFPTRSERNAKALEDATRACHADADGLGRVAAGNGERGHFVRVLEGA